MSGNVPGSEEVSVTELQQEITRLRLENERLRGLLGLDDRPRDGHVQAWVPTLLADPPSDDWLDDLDDPDLDLDELVEQITVDAYGDEGYWSFRQAFEDHMRFPVTGSVIGIVVAVSEVDFDGDERHGLTAAVDHAGRTWSVSLLDVEAVGSPTRFVRLLDAYRRWLGVEA